MVERGSENFFGVLSSKETPLNVLQVALSKAAKDPRIEGLAIKIIDTQMELSQAQEIAALIQKFKASGKWTAAYLESAGEMSPGNLPYLVAASTGDVSLMPEGELDLVGVSIREIFARATLDWLGVRPNFAALGKYKSAANIFTEKDFTPGQHEEDDALVGGMFDQIVGQIASERGITTDQMRAIVDQAPLNAGLSLKMHMVERLEYEDQFTDRMKHHGGGNRRVGQLHRLCASGRHRGALTTFSIANDVAKYFAIIPAMFMATYPALGALNIMRLHTPQSAVLAAVIFNALIIVALVPLALRGVRYRPQSAAGLLRRNLLIYGLGGIIVPFPGIWLIDQILVLLHLA